MNKKNLLNFLLAFSMIINSFAVFSTVSFAEGEETGRTSIVDLGTGENTDINKFKYYHSWTTGTISNVTEGENTFLRIDALDNADPNDNNNFAQIKYTVDEIKAGDSFYAEYEIRGPREVNILSQIFNKNDWSSFKKYGTTWEKKTATGIAKDNAITIKANKTVSQDFDFDNLVIYNTTNAKTINADENITLAPESYVLINDRKMTNAGDTVKFTSSAPASDINVTGAAVTDKGNGTYTFVMPANDVTISVESTQIINYTTSLVDLGPGKDTDISKFKYYHSWTKGSISNVTENGNTFLRLDALDNANETDNNNFAQIKYTVDEIKAGDSFYAEYEIRGPREVNVLSQIFNKNDWSSFKKYGTTWEKSTATGIAKDNAITFKANKTVSQDFDFDNLVIYNTTNAKSITADQEIVIAPESYVLLDGLKGTNAGDRVKFNLKSGNKNQKVFVRTKGGNKEVPVEKTEDNSYAFVMPEDDVKISVSEYCTSLFDLGPGEDMNKDNFRYMNNYDPDHHLIGDTPSYGSMTNVTEDNNTFLRIDGLDSGATGKNSWQQDVMARVIYGVPEIVAGDSFYAELSVRSPVYANMLFQMFNNNFWTPKGNYGNAWVKEKFSGVATDSDIRIHSIWSEGQDFDLDNLKVYKTTNAREIITDDNIEIAPQSFTMINEKKMTNIGDTVKFTVKNIFSNNFNLKVLCGSQEIALTAKENSSYIFEMPDGDVSIAVIKNYEYKNADYENKTIDLFVPEQGERKVIAAEYTADNKLKGIEIIDASTTQNDQTVKLCFNSFDTIDGIRLYCWDNLDNMTPVIPAHDVKKGTGIILDTNVTYPIAPPEDLETKQFDKYNEKGDSWEGLHIINNDLRAKGMTIGGEGGQRMNGLAISADGSFMLIGHDTYPVHKSVDHGKTWHDANRGLAAAGASFAIDPNNNNRALCYGTAQGIKYNNDGGLANQTGLYLTEDQAGSWRQVLSQKYANTQNEFRDSVCWDASSYDETIGGSSVAYWSKNYRYDSFGKVLTDDQIVRTPVNPGEAEGLFKSTDGGNTWFVVNPDMSDAVVKVNPENGTVYCGNLDGFWRSTDGGVTFEHIISGNIIYGLDVIATEPSNVYINDYKGVLVSEDSGATFRRINAVNFPASKDKTRPGLSVRNLKVSPVNPKRMVVCSENTYGGDQNYKYFTKDGGITWKKSKINQGNALFPVNDREGIFVWDPDDENIVWTFGGDYLVRSTDGGANYEYYQDGSEGIAYTGGIVFNLYDPDLLYMGAQDFHGATTDDGGENWEYINNVAGSKWFGCVYGAYRADENTLIACASTKNWNSPCTIKVSRDKGKTWTDTGLVALTAGKGYDQMCYQSPTDFNVLFAGCYRSPDFGYNWEKMDVDFIATHNPYGRKEIYGVKGSRVMKSYNEGVTWEEVYKAPDAEGREGVIWDVAYDGINDILYVVDGRAAVGMELRKIQNGVVRNLRSKLSVNGDRPSLHWVTIDPRYPDIIYTGGYKMYPNTLGVLRSCDGGETFQMLSTVDNEYTIAGKNGETCGGVPAQMAVHPVTGELWVSESCENISKFPPPYEN